jgi:transposase
MLTGSALVSRKHVNVAPVALANKTARIAWALVHNKADYDEGLAAAGV